MSERSREELTQDALANQLVDALSGAMARQPADALLLSGGVDSSLLLALDSVPSFTVGLRGRSNDILRAQEVASLVGADWQGIEITEPEATGLLDELIYLKRSYDPGLLNDIATYKATRVAMEQGLRRIRTGDAADTLFAGYGYLDDVPDFTDYLQKLMPHFFLSPTEIGGRLNIHYAYPYLAEEVLDIALSVPYELHTRDVASLTHADFHDRRAVAGETVSLQRWGKVILRKAAELVLPSHIAWRTKTDLEYGSGMYQIEQELGEAVSDSEVSRLTAEGRNFWNKFHAYLCTRFEVMGLARPRQVPTITIAIGVLAASQSEELIVRPAVHTPRMFLLSSKLTCRRRHSSAYV